MTLKDDKLNIPSWIRTFNFIQANDGTYSSEVSRKLSITYSHLIAILNIMKEYKWIEVRRVEGNNRIKSLHVMPKGITAIKNLGFGTDARN